MVLLVLEFRHIVPAVANGTVYIGMSTYLYAFGPPG
jgi:hypothetical protein